MRFDTDGNILFQTALGETDAQSYGQSVAATEDGVYVVLGNIVENDSVYTVVLKYNSTNTLVWQKIYDIGRGLSITETLHIKLTSNYLHFNIYLSEIFIK